MRPPTVLILGAGASCDYGFPTGRQLKYDVIRDTRPNAPIFNILKRMSYTSEQIEAFRVALDGSADSIHLIQEERQVSQTLQAAHAYLMDARRVCFLGFGFDPKNVELLKLNKPTIRGAAAATPQVFATGYGLREAQRREAEMLVGCEIQFGHEEGSCLDLLKRFPILAS